MVSCARFEGFSVAVKVCGDMYAATFDVPKGRELVFAEKLIPITPISSVSGYEGKKEPLIVDWLAMELLRQHVNDLWLQRAECAEEELTLP